MAGDTSPEDYQTIFRALGERELPYFIEGGQAVNVWAEYFEAEESNLKKFRPYTSKDCDLWIGPNTFTQLRQGFLDGAGKLMVSDSPASGQIGIFTINGQPRRVIDLMQDVYGIKPKDINKAYSRSIDFGEFRVLDPLFLFKSKCHCLVNLDQDTRQDERHLRMLSHLIPHYYRFLVEEAKKKSITPRALISDVKLFRAFAKDGWVRQALSKLSLNLDSMIPIDSMKNCGLLIVERYANQTWP